MASFSITSEDVLVTYKSKIEEAIQLLLSIPPHYKAEAWQFWQIVTQTVRLFTQASLDESTPFIPPSNILSDPQSSSSVISLLSNFPMAIPPSSKIKPKSSKFKLAQKKKKPNEKKKTKKSPVRKKAERKIVKKNKKNETSSKGGSTKTTATTDNETEVAAQTLTEAYTNAFTPISTLDFSDLVSSNPNSVQSIHLHYEETTEVTVKPVILLPQDEQNIAAGSVRTVGSQADDDEDDDADDPNDISDVVSQEILIEEVDIVDEKDEKQKENKRPKRIRYKKNMRVKKIQTDPEFDPVAISIKAEIKESKEKKRKEEKEKRQKRKSIKKQGFLYEGHSYSKVPDEVLEAIEEVDDLDPEPESDPVVDLMGEPSPAKVRKKKGGRKRKEKPKGESEEQPRLRRKRRTREEMQQASLECKECGVKLASLGSLDVHMRSHTGERPYQCTTCPKSFTTKGNLQRHEMHHKGLRPFICDICEASFTENKSLKVHMRIHTGEKPFRCKVCDKAFSQSGPLQVHLKIHDGVKPHLCDICGKKFRHKCNLNHHKDRHHDIKKFKCGERGCTMGFCSKNELQSHLRTHTKLKDYMCNICNKTYSRYQYLKEHMNQHTGERPFVCPYCPEKFPDHGSFHKHKINAHEDEVEIKNRILERVPLESLEKLILKGMEEKGSQKGKTPTKETTPTKAVNQSVAPPTEENIKDSANERNQAADLTQGPEGEEEEEEEETVIHVILSDWSGQI